jgi:hypothetical protein
LSRKFHWRRTTILIIVGRRSTFHLFNIIYCLYNAYLHLFMWGGLEYPPKSRRAILHAWEMCMQWPTSPRSWNSRSVPRKKILSLPPKDQNFQKFFQVPFWRQWKNFIFQEFFFIQKGRISERAWTNSWTKEQLLLLTEFVQTAALLVQLDQNVSSWIM